MSEWVMTFDMSGWWWTGGDSGGSVVVVDAEGCLYIRSDIADA